jgi:hypothetical protein
MHAIPVIYPQSRTSSVQCAGLYAMQTNTIHYSFIVRLFTGSNLNLSMYTIDSGHGSRVQDLNGDEIGGYDEGNANESSSGYAESYESWQ